MNAILDDPRPFKIINCADVGRVVAMNILGGIIADANRGDELFT